MKTRTEVEDLKRRWLKDPCWDLSSADGFEEYETELLGFELEHQALSSALREKNADDAYRNTPAGDATLRDMFAAHALSVLIGDGYWNRVWLATRSYEMADSMMEARRK